MTERPEEAWWSEEDNEWVFGVKNDAGELIGLVRYWDEDGVFISDAEHVDGKPHGRARRFFPDGSVSQDSQYRDGVIHGARSIFRPQNDAYLAKPASGYGNGMRFRDLPKSITVFECVYDEGDLIGTLFRDAEGTEVDRDGQAVPERPKGVEATASYFGHGRGRQWIFMRRKGEEGSETLEMRLYFSDGSLKEETKLDGTSREFHQNGKLQSHEQDGMTVFGDEDGHLRRESHYVDKREVHRIWRRPASEAGPDGEVECSGPVEGFRRHRHMEAGVWTFVNAKDETLRTVDFGDIITDEELLAHAALSEEGGHAQGVGAVALISALRDPSIEPHLHSPTHPWKRLDNSGELIEGHQTLNEKIHALAFDARADVIEGLVSTFHALDRPRLALDILDTELSGGGDTSLRSHRVKLLRALGELDAAEAELNQLDPNRVRPEEEALLFAIRRDPDDEEAKNNYAKYVESFAPTHAALIRAGQDPDPLLEEALNKTLPDPVKKVLSLNAGFHQQEKVYVGTDDFVAHYDALFRFAPQVTGLGLVYADEHMAGLVTMPSLRRYNSLSFIETSLYSGRAAQLASCPYLEQLDHLGLFNTNLYDEDLILLLQSKGFTKLRSLDIGNGREGQDYTIEALRELPKAAFAPHLEELTMTRRYFDEEMVEVFAQLPKLHSLDIEGSDLGFGLVDLVALDRPWTHLGLERSGIGNAAATALAQSPHMAKLDFLDISSNDELSAEGLTALAKSPHLTRLKHLDLGGSSTTSDFAEALVDDSPMAHSLETLLFSLGKLGPEGAKALALAPLHKLTRLNLHNNKIGDTGTVALAKSTELGALRFLDISGNEVTDVGATTLLESSTLSNLSRLELGGAELSDSMKSKLTQRFGDGVKFKYPWGR